MENTMSRNELTSAIPHEPVHPVLDLLRSGAACIWRSIRRRWTQAQDRQHLMQLPDSILHDIGLGRSEIDVAVRWGRRP